MTGWLRDRTDANLARLHRPDYEPARVLAGTGDWPGDMPGRLILALSRLATVTGSTSDRLHQLVDGLDLNAAGYLGPVRTTEVDEQQLAGHGWLASGLISYHRLTGDGLALDRAHRIATALLAPGVNRLDSYPERIAVADSGGAAAGTTVERQGEWVLSSDTYCVFIALEGLVSVYAATGDDALAAAIDRCASTVDSADLPGARAQLHASMTAARCLLDAGRSELATRIYDLYAASARTVNHATYNWFGRPDSWCEPCATVDTFLLALGLWRTSRSQRYLEDARRILLNGLGRAQRSHGGFGCDTCTDADHPVLGTHIDDAWWCCTMRGAVGLTEAVGAAYSVVGDVVSVDLFQSGVTEVNGVTLRQRTSFPAGGDVWIETDRDVKLSSPGVMAPTTVRAGGELHIQVPMTEHRENVDAAGDLVRWMRGPLLLGQADDVDELVPVGLAPTRDYRVVFAS